MLLVPLLTLLAVLLLDLLLVPLLSVLLQVPLLPVPLLLVLLLAVPLRYRLLFSKLIRNFFIWHSPCWQLSSSLHQITVFQTRCGRCYTPFLAPRLCCGARLRLGSQLTCIPNWSGPRCTLWSHSLLVYRARLGHMC